jgi:hypothetical protein
MERAVKKIPQVNKRGWKAINLISLSLFLEFDKTLTYFHENDNPRKNMLFTKN